MYGYGSVGSCPPQDGDSGMNASTGIKVVYAKSSSRWMDRQYQPRFPIHLRHSSAGYKNLRPFHVRRPASSVNRRSQTATIAPPCPNAHVREADEPRVSTIAARPDILVAVALSIPDLRVARVQALKARIAAGTYDVPARQVAETMLEQMQPPRKAGGHCQSFGA